MLLPITGSPASTGIDPTGNPAGRAPASANLAEPPAPVQQAQDNESRPAASVDAAQLQEALQRMREKVRAAGSELHFELDRNTGKTLVKVIDAQSNEVIRQIPPEEMLAIARNIDRMEGLLIRQKA